VRAVECRLGRHASTVLDERQFRYFSYDDSTIPVERPHAAPGRLIAASNIVTQSDGRSILTGRGGDVVMWSFTSPRLDLSDLAYLHNWSALKHRMKWYRSFQGLNYWTMARVDLLKPFLARHGIVKDVSPHESWIKSNRTEPRRDARLNGTSKMSQRRPSVSAALRYLRDIVAIQATSPFWAESNVMPTYPYMDRKIVSFMLSIPFEQKFNGVSNRVLHRRAMTSLLPTEIATRQSKASALEPSCRAIRREWSEVMALCDGTPELVRREIVDRSTLKEALRAARDGHATDAFSLVRVISLESWLRYRRSMASTWYAERGRVNGLHVRI
jgi:hypothetical protein